MENLTDIAWDVQIITPQIATEMLHSVATNGRLDQALLQSFERDMRCRRWALNGAPIIVSKDGQILDGRARLHSCVRAGVAFQTLVVRGVHAEAFETIDSVRKRTLADVLSIRSERHGRSLGAALRIIWSYQAGLTPGRGKPGTMALLSLLEQRPEVRDSLLPALRAVPLLPHGCSIALHYLTSRIDPEKADRFIGEIGEPVSTEASSPIIQLRNALMALRGQGGARKQVYILAIAIKTWNAFYKGLKIKHLRFSPDHEAFPKLDVDAGWGPLGDGQ